MTDKSLHINVVCDNTKRWKMLRGNQFSYPSHLSSENKKIPAPLNHLILSIDNIFLLIYYIFHWVENFPEYLIKILNNWKVFYEFSAFQYNELYF